MATEKERHIKAELLRDPDYAAAWAKVRLAMREGMQDAANGGKAQNSPVIPAMAEFYAFLDTRPDLVKLIEAAEGEDH